MPAIKTSATYHELRNRLNVELKSRGDIASLFPPNQKPDFFSTERLQEIKEKVTFSQLQSLCKLIDSFEIYKKPRPYRQYDETGDFLEFLKKNGEIEALLVLIQLGADKEDCIDEEVDARNCLYTRGSNSLQWLAAKAVTKYGIPITEDIPEPAIEIIKAAKKYVTQELIEEPVRKSRWIPTGICEIL